MFNIPIYQNINVRYTDNIELRYTDVSKYRTLMYRYIEIAHTGRAGGVACSEQWWGVDAMVENIVGYHTYTFDISEHRTSTYRIEKIGM